MVYSGYRLNIPYGIWNVCISLLWLPRLFVWTYPMGFETTLHGYYKFDALVWTYPMGFETYFCFSFYFRWVWFEHTLWDLKLRHRATDCAIEGLNIPYGIWNPRSMSGNCNSSGLNIPYGIWNCKIWATRWAKSKVWTYPMGFETLRRSSSRTRRLCLNIPYGIWNCFSCR